MRKTISICLLSLFLFYGGYNKLLRSLEIPNTSIREALSIPFQQTARYVKYYESEVTSNEKEAIDKVLVFDTLGSRYEEELSDQVKNKYNRYATKEDLKNYFVVWFKMFFKKPMTYLNATMNNVYGYFYPNVYKGYIYSALNNKLPEAGFDYHFNKLEMGRLLLTGYSEAFKYIPIISLSVNCAFYTWIYLYLACILIINHKNKYLILLLPALSLVLMNIAGPANTYFRYVLPYAFSLPLILGLIIKEINPKFIRKK